MSICTHVHRYHMYKKWACESPDMHGQLVARWCLAGGLGLVPKAPSACLKRPQLTDVQVTPSGFHSAFSCSCFWHKDALALNQEPLSSLLLAWIIELTANWFGYWKDTSIVAQVTKQTKNSKFNWWLIRNIFHILGLLHVFVTISKCICSITHSTTTACLLVLCWWVTLVCAFPLRSRSTADHCTVCSFQSKPREALAVSLLSLRSFCRVYCWVSS